MTQLFNQKKFTGLRKKLRTDVTKSERVLWSHIKHSQLGGWKFRRQCGVGRYVVDFYCPRLRLVVEIDGLTHSEETVFENDVRRQQYLEQLGLLVKRYDSGAVFYTLDDILSDLFQTCEEREKQLCELTTSRPPSY